MLDQLREVTGVQDPELLRRALVDSRAPGGSVDMERAVALLLNGCTPADQPAVPRAVQPPAKVGTGGLLRAYAVRSG